jgi:hypothetical protein
MLCALTPGTHSSIVQLPPDISFELGLRKSPSVDRAVCAPADQSIVEERLNTKITASAHTRFERDQVAVLFDRCQVLAGRFSELSASALIAEMDGLVVQLPASLNRAEQVMIGGVLVHLLARLVRGAGIDGRADVAGAFVNLADAGPTMDSWRLQWFRTTGCCTAALPSDIATHDSSITDIPVSTEAPEPRL